MRSGEIIHYHGDDAEVIIPEGVTQIGTAVFRNRERLRRVVLPSTLKTIGESAFADCIHLEEVVGDPTLTYVGRDAFAGTPWLLHQGDFPVLGGTLLKLPILFQGDLDIPEGVRTIPNGMFRECTEITGVRLPKGVEVIGSCAFEECVHLKWVELQEGLKRVKNSAFRNCIALERINLPHSLESIGISAFLGCTALRGISLAPKCAEYGVFQKDWAQVPAESPPQVLSEIGFRAFCNCASLDVNFR